MLNTNQRRGRCKPCRELHLQCDEKTPRCGACISSNKICSGYDFGTIFINMNSAAPPPMWTRSSNASKNLVIDLASQPSSSKASKVPPRPESVPFMVQDPGQIQQLTALFVDLYYRQFDAKKASPEPMRPGAECAGWRRRVSTWTGKYTVLDTAIRALCASFTGAQYQDVGVIDQARSLYSQALQLLHFHLSQPGSSKCKDLLRTSLILGSVELFLSSGGGPNQLIHVQGATRMLHCMIEDTAVQTFEEVHVSVYNQTLRYCLCLRQDFSLSAGSFASRVQQLYASYTGFRKSMYFQWCLIVSPLSTMLHWIDSTAAAAPRTPPNPSHVQSTLDNLRCLEQALAPWVSTLKATVTGPWAKEKASSNVYAIPFPLKFASYEACMLYCLYWTSQLLIVDAQLTLLSLLPAGHTHFSREQYQLSASGYADLICRSVPFCTKETSYAITENIFVPLTVVARYYERQRDVDRTRWCLAAFARITEEQRIGFAPDFLQYQV
ncbi:hypothetical protein M011DRAFT_172541 [Sporormia fimetaria CBS 119925]|uniref:Zn(2)-C6 fungal-type domain-containing protein n=1 Tax=Sporormia fimetaria CBS 119925 TaxID=1340428 RepID=A0A6A6V1S5_9PLEO|nr:hypothetical protein M011DRAFT_172541 [Sporormia fimetaria CBS 119925]